ncbi:MAG: hypothetical protein GY903_05400 [Fuerstiella sp.]|nr:hypothetical protein [Fuerstiella sp.]MCP4853910.1 hypothetical protein [Fuerstiella sp.]
MAKQYIVYDSGKRSKPATKEHIREMYAAGKIPDEAMVHSVDRGKSMPVVAFLDRSKARREPAPPAEMSNEETQATPPVQPQDVVNVWQPAASDEVPPVAPLLHSQSAPMGGSRAVRTFFLFRGFNIPKTGVVATRDYLRKQVGWLEVWLKAVHLANIICLSLLVGAIVLAAFTVTVFLTDKAADNRADIFNFVSIGVLTAPGYLLAASALFAIYANMKILEAFLRVAPACIRYWIETTEERRLSNI